MQDDNSADVISDDDIADEPLFGDTTPVAETATETAQPTEEPPTVEGSEAEKTEEDADKPTEANDTEATAEDDTSEQTPETTAEKGKPDPALAYKAYQERQQRKTAVAQQIDEVYAPKSQEDLYQEAIDKGLTEEQAVYEARIQAVEERASFREERARISELNASMQAEAVNALHDFPIFNPDSKDYDEDFASRVQAAYQRDSRIQTDENGIILQADRPLYDYYKEKVDDYNRGLERGLAQSNAERRAMESRTEDVGSSSPTSKGPETLEEMGERLANMPLI